jgi:hypothetical protein
VWRVAAATANGWDQQALRRKQLADNYVGPLMQEVEAGQRPKWKDVSDWSPIYKSYWAQWKFLEVRDGMLERHWELADRKKKMAQIVISHNKVKEVLVEIHGGTSGRHLELTKSSTRSGNVTIGCTNP